jgi:probable addiction module antidote protein
MRIDYGPGYRIYYVHRGAQIVILLCGGRQAHATEGYQTGPEAGGDIVMPRTTRFDAADYLDTEQRQVAYIAAALESGDADFVRDALGLVARARGMGGIAKKAGLNRESLYKALGETGNPEFGTVMRIVRALGLTLSARPVASGQTSKRRRVA